MTNVNSSAYYFHSIQDFSKGQNSSGFVINPELTRERKPEIVLSSTCYGPVIVVDGSYTLHTQPSPEEHYYPHFTDQETEA